MIPDLTRRLYLATAYGTPAPQGSKSVGRTGVMYEQNKRSRPWRREMVETFVSTAPPVPYDEPVEVRATFVLPRPKRPRFPVPGVKPDTDKLQRNLGDALEVAGILRDDSRIVEWHVRKIYAQPDQAPRVTVEVLTYDPLQWAGLGGDS